MPEPCLVKLPPVIAEARVTVLPLVSNVPPLAPSGASCEEMSAVLPAAHCSPPPFRVIAPAPKLPAAEKLIRPPLIVVPPR